MKKPILNLLFLLMGMTSYFSYSQSVLLVDTMQTALVSKFDTAKYVMLLQQKQRSSELAGCTRLIGKLGLANHYCGGEEDNATFLGTNLTDGGFNLSLGLDYFFSRLGVGFEVGWQQLPLDVTSVRPGLGSITLQQHLMRTVGLTSANAAFSSAKPLNMMYFVVGPTYYIPIGNKLRLELYAKGGLFHNDAPSYGVYNRNDAGKRILGGIGDYGVSNKFHFGGIFGTSLFYNLTKNFSLGVYAQAFGTNVNYGWIPVSANPPSTLKGDFGLNGFSVGLTGSQCIGCKAKQSKVNFLAADGLPKCATPSITDNLNGKVYELGTNNERPKFSWKSNLPMASADEQFTFRLYKEDVDADKPVYQIKTKDSEMIWPNDVPLPSEPGVYYYVLHSNNGPYCLSESVVSSFKYIAKPKPIETIVTPAMERRADQYVFSIYGASEAATSYVRPATKVIKRRPISKIIDQRVVTKTKRIIRPVRKSTMGMVSKSVETNSIMYQNTTNDTNISWPSDLPLPKRAGVYTYELQRLSTEDCKPTGTVAKYRFYIDPNKPSEIRIIPNK